MALQFRNGRTGELVNTEMSRSAIVQKFLESATDDNWLWFWLVKHADQMKGACPVMVDMKLFLADSFMLAVGMGLERPMIRLHDNDRRYKIYLSAKGTICFKTGALIAGTNKPFGDEQYMGCLTHGKFLPSRDRNLLDLDQQFLDSLMADPAGYMSERSKDMDRCCYCYKALEDKRSKDVGYGSTCAVRWGLPWGKTYDEKVPSFAQMWAKARPDDRRGVRGICNELRKTPFDQLAWDALGDLMEEAGYAKRPTAPKRDVRIPRND